MPKAPSTRALRTAASLKFPIEPMEARTADKIPDGDGWQHEPKWDGFRCIAFRDGSSVRLQSKNGRPLGRYFPEVVDAVAEIDAHDFVLDGELVVPADRRLSFESLQLRLHPAASRVRKLARESPAWFIAFDLLATGDEPKLFEAPLSARRAALEKFAGRRFGADVRLSPASSVVRDARRWLRQSGPAFDGVISKRTEAPYSFGSRDAVVKVKNIRTADCVVGGFRYASKGSLAGSLLLGLYNAEGFLDHVGFTSSFPRSERETITRRLEALREPPGFSGSAPGGPSRWATERSTQWAPVRPDLVVEVAYDHFTGGRFRHGTKFLRWRPDKAPESCRFDQVESGAVRSVESIFAR